MPEIVGACVCGAVRYASPAEPLVTVFCHCRGCQKGGGGPYSANIAVPVDSLSIEGRVKRHRASGEPGRSVTRTFCPECGTPLALEAESFSGVILVQAGTLDDPSWVQPELHIWCSSAQPWDPLPEGATCVPGNPPPPA